MHHINNIMPLFHKKTKSNSPTNGVSFNGNDLHHQPTHQQQQQPTQMMTSPIKQNLPPPSLVFHCQLANGSPTGLITGFSSVKELYVKIAQCFDISEDQVSLRFFSSSFSAINNRHNRLLCFEQIFFGGISIDSVTIILSHWNDWVISAIKIKRVRNESAHVSWKRKCVENVLSAEEFHFIIRTLCRRRGVQCEKTFSHCLNSTTEFNYAAHDT